MATLVICGSAIGTGVGVRVGLGVAVGVGTDVGVAVGIGVLVGADVGVGGIAARVALIFASTVASMSGVGVSTGLWTRADPVDGICGVGIVLGAEQPIRGPIPRANRAIMSELAL